MFHEKINGKKYMYIKKENRNYLQTLHYSYMICVDALSNARVVQRLPFFDLLSWTNHGYLFDIRVDGTFSKYYSAEPSLFR